ncbi:hypothetical protein NA78x_001332 [Anatilimnocola sp. NA78]|uniref:hypothetical protein n=1 Tax=Anatilimnocola sp. NA78 TaxID=3415683 RepID=UPI003CE4BD9E
MSRFRFACLLVALSVLLGSPLCAEPPVSYLVYREKDNANHQKVSAALDKQVSYEFEDTPLKEVMQRIAIDLKINIVLTKKIEDAGVQPDQPVTKQVTDVSLRSFLRLLLEDLNLTFMVRDEVLKITTLEDAQSPEKLAVRIYPVKDLIDAGVVVDGKPKFHFDPLIEILTQTIEPDSWNDVGGPGSIKGFDNAASLIISQRDDIHETIGQLFTTLRVSRAGQNLGASATGSQPASSTSAPGTVRAP